MPEQITRTLVFIFLSRFLQFVPAFYKNSAASCTRIRSAAHNHTSAPGLKSRSFLGRLSIKNELLLPGR